MSKVCASVATKYEEFLRATLISIGLIGRPPASALKCSSHSSLNVADVQIHAIQRTHHTDRVRPVFQHARCPDGIGFLVQIGQRAGGKVIVYLMIILLAALDLLLDPIFSLRAAAA